MARRGLAPNDRGSQKDNPSSIRPNGVNAQQEFKVKVENIKKEKGKQRAPVDDEDGAEGYTDEGSPREGEDDADGEVDGEQGDGSPKGHKRARVNDDGDSQPVQNGVVDKERTRGVTLPRDADGFIPGSIVRIQLRNFVTYDYVEFRPGPYLNMIVGPNGTGKSSIACAICLGLNWPPSVLGRASELNSFVKIGAGDGHIEIELKGPKGKDNLIIRRNLDAKTKASTFSLNGNTATGREITQKMAELNVQVGNLCSFLPQDKVSEFAAMTPQQLLRETQRAAGNEHLTAWHDTLINCGKELRELRELIKSECDQLKTMQARNEGIERDVQRFKDRKKIEQEIELLEVLIPVQEYREMRAKFMETKALQRKLHEKVSKLKKKNEPAHELLKKLDTQHKEYNTARDSMKKSTQDKFARMKDKWTASENLENDAEELALKLDSLKKEEKERAKKIKALEADITKLKVDLDKPVKLEKVEVLVEETRKLNSDRQDVISRHAALQESLKANIDKKAMFEARLNSGMADLKNLDDYDVRKLQAMSRWDRDTHDAILWLRQNHDKFEHEVLEPPFMCLTVPNKNYVNAVETCFNAAQIKTFVFGSQKDCDVFNHNINDVGVLGRKTRVATWFRPHSQQDEASLPAPPMSRDELRALNFDGYATDYVSCPDGMYWFLRRELNMHRTAIGLNGNIIDVNKAMQAVSRFGPNGEGGGANFIAGTILNIVARSRYGKRAIQNMTRDVRPARNLVAATIDPDVKRRIDASIADAKREIEMINVEHEEIRVQLKQVDDEDKVFKKRIDDIDSQKQAIRREQARQVSLRSKLNRCQETLQTYLNAPSADRERVNIKKRLLDKTRKRMTIAGEYTELARLVIANQMKATEHGLEFLQVGANKLALEELCEKKDEKYNAALAEFMKVDKKFQEIKAQSKEVLNQSRQVISGITPELRERYNEIETARMLYDKEAAAAEQEKRTPPPADGVDLRSLDQLQAELETQRAALELNINTNPGVVEQYEKRKREIEQLEKTIKEKEKKAEKIERNITKARDNWQPALEKLVGSIGEKFSAAFDRIGCAGEIRVSEHEDYEKWAIDILVKFRDNEKLQLLTGHRQSGGERSLTTILYLMSLTEEAHAPFSLVDEINQGMDQRAERNVHNSMVEVTCKSDSAQYFLITPKLLPDLNYHRRMKILCVNNGEWLPQGPGLGNMMGMIETFVRQNRSPNAA